MKLVVISPEGMDPREPAVLAALFAAGLERYHLRKPHVNRPSLAAWLAELPSAWRARIVLHQYHEMMDTLGLGGRHYRDVSGSAGAPHASATAGITSRSCHDLATLRAALGEYDSVFFGPVFPSLSKPGYGPQGAFPADELASLLATRCAGERRTDVLALGGIVPERVARCRALGFDGVAVLGAVWHAPDPVKAFIELRNMCHKSGDYPDGRGQLKDVGTTAAIQLLS